MNVTSATIRVLHVDDDPQFGELVATALEREDDRIEVVTAPNASSGMERLADGDIDCIVSDYEIVTLNGIEFLENVRNDHPNLPFILFTGKGSEAVASDAISAGVTDYLQKESGTDHYSLLANRIRNAVDHVRSQRRLSERNRRLETLVDSLPGIAYQARNEPGWPMESFEGECVALCGYSATQLEAGELFWGRDIIHTEDRQHLWQTAQKALETGEQFEFTYRIQTRDGETKWVWERGQGVYGPDGSITSVEGFITEITDRVQREQVIEDLHSTAQKVLQARSRDRVAEIVVDVICDTLKMPVNGVWFHDAEADVLRPATCSDRAAEFVGGHPTFRSDESLAWKAFATGSSRYHDDVSNADGRHNPDTEIRSEIILPLGDHGVVIIGSLTSNAFDEIDVSLAETVTAHAETALDRIDREQELERQNRRLAEFSRAASHDLRNPLQVATGGVDLARETGDINHLEMATDALDRMDDLIRDLLTLARDGDTADDLKQLDVTRIANRCWATVDTERATLIVDADRRVEANETRLKQVFENLFRNAVEYGGEDVTVMVSALEDGFVVEDDGPGIPPDERELVLESGYSSTASGTGFGLSIVTRIVDAHDWRLHITEGSDGGTRIEITNVETGGH